MYAQFFGAYLLNNNHVTREQLTEAFSKVNDAHIKLGTLAIHQGLMTGSEVDEVCLMQTREDKRFGNIAVERGYLTDEQVSDLLKAQNPDYLLLGQILVDIGALDNTKLETLLIDYQSDAEIFEMDYDSNDKTDRLIQKFFQISETPVTDYTVMYLSLLFNNLVRFVGGDYTPLAPVPVKEYPVNFCVNQKVIGEKNFVSRIDMTPEVAIQFATRYAKMDFTEFDEYVKASLEDFVNLHNGLFTVNMSNEYSMDLTLEPPVQDETEVLILNEASYVIPVIYPFGTIHFIVSF